MPDADRTGSVAVTIYGKTYHLQGGDDPGYLEELAEIVDGKMREVSAATGTADTLKVAILASLNIADEYLKAGQSGSGSKGRSKDRVAEQRLARMVTLLDEALAG